MKLDRRTFLQASTAAALCGLAPAPAAARSLSRAGSTKTLVLVFLRGGADGLNIIVPHGDETYYSLRKSIAIARPGTERGALDLDGFFGLHPAAADLLRWFQEGAAVAVHAVGHAKNTRSHFEEQDLWETCVSDNVAGTDGWMNRHLASSEARGPVRGLAMGNSLPRVLRGEASALAVRSLADLTSPDAAQRLASYESALRAAHTVDDGRVGARAELARSGRAALEAMKELAKVAELERDAQVEYPGGAFPKQLSEVAKLVRADIGLELVELSVGGWDTHQNQGGATGAFANRLREVAGGLNAFAQDLGDAFADVHVLVVSEFGRTAAQNGTGGTDHGWGNCVLALGGAVAAKSGGMARKVLGEWPGLAPEELVKQRDLRHTTDFRDVFAEVVQGHLGNPELEFVLPGHEPRSVGVI